MPVRAFYICTFICWEDARLPGLQAREKERKGNNMRIAIDYTAAIRQGAGIGTYVRNLVAAMLEQDQNNQYTLLTSGHPTAEHPFPTVENVRGRSILIPDRYLNILWYRLRAPLPAT